MSHSPLIIIQMLVLIALTGCSSASQQSTSPNAKSKEMVLAQVRKDFPKRCGVKFVISDEKSDKPSVQIERSQNGEHWRITMGFQQVGVNDYLVYETLAGPSEAIQVYAHGNSDFGLKRFVADRTHKNLQVKFKGGMNDTGSGRLLRHHILFGCVPNKNGIADVHSESFAKQTTLETNPDGSMELVYTPSGVRFRYSSDFKCELVSLPEYLVGRNGELSVRFYWQLNPDHSKRFDDGGLLVFEATGSDDVESATWFENVAISKLEPSEGLDDFKICIPSKRKGIVTIGQRSVTSPDEQPDNATAKAKQTFEAAGVPMQNGEFKKALELIRQAIKLDPEQRHYKFGILMVLQRVGFEKSTESTPEAANLYFYEAGKIARALMNRDAVLSSTQKRSLRDTMYNEASAYALDGRQEEAFESLQVAFGIGHFDFEHLSINAAFDSIRENTEFMTLVENAQAQLVARATLETVQQIKEFKSFEFDFDLKDVDGEDVKLSDFKDKLVIVDLWGTWCQPCQDEIPHFIKLKETFADRGLAIVGVNYEMGNDEEEARNTIKQFMLKSKINYPCLIGDAKTRKQISDFSGYPTTLFIGRDGKVKLLIVGLATYPKLESIVTALISEQASID